MPKYFAPLLPRMPSQYLTTLLLAFLLAGPASANEKDNLLDFLVSGSRSFIDAASGIQECYVEDPTRDALIVEARKDVANLDIERLMRRVTHASAKYQEHAQFQVIQAELDILRFRLDDALVKYDRVLEQCPLVPALRTRKADLLIGMGRLDQATETLNNAALQLVIPDQIAYFKALIAYHRGDTAETRKLLMKIRKPEILEGRVEILASQVALELPQAPKAELTEVPQSQGELSAETKARAKPNGVPTTPRQFLFAFSDAVEAGDVAAAKNTIDKLLSRYPDTTTSYLLAFYLAYEIEDFAGAQTHLDGFAKRVPDYPMLDMLKGRLARSRGQFDIAIKAYEKQISITPGYRWPYEELFNAYTESGLYKELIGTANEFTEELFPNYYQFTRIAKALRTLDRYDEALEWSQKAISLDPNNEFAYRGQGHTYVLLNRLEDARKSFEKSLQLNPGNVEGLMGMSSVFRHRGDYAKAKSYAQKALQLWPNSFLAKTEFATVSYHLGDTETALQTCESMSNNQVMGHWQKLLQAECYQFSKAHVKALTLYRELYEENNQAYLLAIIGHIYWEQGRLEEARVELKNAVDLDPSNISTRVKYASLLYELKDWPESEVQFGEALNSQKKEARNWFLYGDTQRLQGKCADALKAYAKAIDLEAGNIEPVYGNARCYELLDKMDEAKTWYQMLLEFPDKEVFARGALAAFYYNRHEFDTALLHAQAGLKIEEDNYRLVQLAADAASGAEQYQPMVHYAYQLLGTGHESPRHVSWVANHLVKVGMLEEATKVFRLLVSMTPESQVNWNDLGSILYLQEEYDLALQAFEKSLTLGNVISDVVYYNIGRVHLKQGNKEKASKAFREAKRLGYSPEH